MRKVQLIFKIVPQNKKNISDVCRKIQKRRINIMMDVSLSAQNRGTFKRCCENVESVKIVFIGVLEKIPKCRFTRDIARKKY